jgi:hypothetical protein
VPGVGRATGGSEGSGGHSPHEQGKLGAVPGKHDDRVMAFFRANVAAKESGIEDSFFLWRIQLPERSGP